MTLKDKLFSFEGRLRRQDYWLISIGLGLLVFVVTEAVMLGLFGPGYSMVTGGVQAAMRRVEDGLPYVVQMLLNCTTIWPNLAMSAKRRHDRDKSAKFVVILLAVIWVVGFVQVPIAQHFAEAMTTLPMAFGYLAYNLIMLVLTIYLFVVVGCLDGTPGPNRFGPSPKASELPDAA